MNPTAPIASAARARPVVGSSPRTNLPFLRKIVQEALRKPNTVCQPYPALIPGESKQRESCVLYKDPRCVLVNDAYPKARLHCLVMPLDPPLDSLNALREEHVPLLQHVMTVAERYVQFLRTTAPDQRYAAMAFATGFHALPSLPQLHMHLISLDFDSPCLKTKKHYNSFATPFFLPAEKVLEDLVENGCVTLNRDVAQLRELEEQQPRCLWCGQGQMNIPQLKAHLSTCPMSRAQAHTGQVFIVMRPQSTVFRHRARVQKELGDSSQAGVISEAAEAENDELMKALLSDVHRVKQRFTAMGTEVRRQNTLLDGLESVFGSARMRIGKALRSLDDAGLSSFTHMWVLFVFALLVFMFIYIAMKFR